MNKNETLYAEVCLHFFEAIERLKSDKVLKGILTSAHATATTAAT